MWDPLFLRLLFMFIAAHATKRTTEDEKAFLPLFPSDVNNSSRMRERAIQQRSNDSIYTCLSIGPDDSGLLFVPCTSSEECLQKLGEIEIDTSMTSSTSFNHVNSRWPEPPRTWCVNRTGILVYKANNSDLYDFRAIGPPLNVITANNTELIKPQYQLPQEGDMQARIVAKKYFVNQSIEVTCMASKFIYNSNPKISVLYRNGTTITAMDVAVDSESRNVTASLKFDSTEVVGIECSAPRWDKNENDSYQYLLNVSDPIPYEVISQSESPIYLQGTEENVVIACSIQGAPPPKTVWKKNGQLPYATPFIHHFEDGVNTSLTFLMAASRNRGASPQTDLTYITHFSSPQEITGEYILYITNDGNKPACRIKIEMENPTSTRPSIASFVAILSTSALVFLMVLLVIKIKFHKSFVPLTKVLSRISRTSSDNSENFKDEPSDVTIEIGDEEMRISETPEKVGKVGNLITSCAYLSLMQTEDEFDVVPESALTIGSCIGCGFSGNVYRGRFYDKDVAMKRMSNNGCQWLQAVTRELSILASIGRHPNVIELVTALRVDCGFYGSLGDVAIITEFCENGDLKTYLSKRKNSFRNEIQEDKIVISDCYDQIHHNNSADSRYVAVLPDFVSTTDLMLWAVQFARGMDFLASQNVVHGDVALRNLLLDGNKILKVSDFGLSKRLHGDSEYYKMKSDERIPWANCAPEFLDTFKASANTDIWGFGVALWEMFTLGQVPYLGEFDSCTRTFRTVLKEGHRLRKPIYATTAVYKVMTSCWNITPKLRPSFKDLAQSLECQCPPSALPAQEFTNDRALDLPVAYSRIEPIDFKGQ